MKKLRLILGDQLNINHSWYLQKSEDTTYLIMEMLQETNYVQHHLQKVVAFFLAMRNFAEELKKLGNHVIYLKIDDPLNTQCLTQNLEYIINKLQIEEFEYQLPDEYRLDQQLIKFSAQSKIPVKVVDTEHFLTTREYLHQTLKEPYLMETFYRNIRKKFNFLMDAGKPVGGKWNFDHENRNKIKSTKDIPERLVFKNEYHEVLNSINKLEIKTIGQLDSDYLPWTISRQQSLELLEYFCKFLLPEFGTYQDAMHTEGPYLYHSRLSFALNTKLISPKEVVDRAIQEWKNNQDKISLAQIEGFIRQIIGWREYMRGIYWAKMPEYKSKNYFGNERKLPDFYWTGDTKMNCLKHAIQSSLNNAYAHHIQRLMITGNFALLIGVDPDYVDEWYLGIYIDAIEWVEITNTRGMSQYADGGLLATKPYISSANYIDKMSNYCTGCFYDKKQKFTENACPFNCLYWNFLEQHKDKLGTNPRLFMPYRNLDKMTKEEKDKIRIKSLQIIDSLN